MTYTIYINFNTQTATIHETDCGHLFKHGGKSYNDPPTGDYIDAVEGCRAACLTAWSTGHRARFCRHCVGERTPCWLDGPFDCMRPGGAPCY